MISPHLQSLIWLQVWQVTLLVVVVGFVAVTTLRRRPLIFGFRRPLIVLPEIMVKAKSIAQLEPILAHELIHVRRGDTIFGALQFVGQVIWWFHPMIWWATRQANRACERCCDAEVIASLNYRPRDYANALLDVLEFKSELRPRLAMPGISKLSSRCIW